MTAHPFDQNRSNVRSQSFYRRRSQERCTALTCATCTADAAPSQEAAMGSCQTPSAAAADRRTVSAPGQMQGSGSEGTFRSLIASSLKDGAILSIISAAAPSSVAPLPPCISAWTGAQIRSGLAIRKVSLLYALWLRRNLSSGSQCQKRCLPAATATSGLLSEEWHLLLALIPQATRLRKTGRAHPAGTSPCRGAPAIACHNKGRFWPRAADLAKPE